MVFQQQHKVTEPSEIKLSKGEQTRIKIINAAIDLFHAQGIAGTGISQILAQAEAGKSQFYQHFSSKSDLAKAVLDRWQSEIVTATKNIRNFDDLSEWLLNTLHELTIFEGRRGCPIATIAYSCDLHKLGIRENVKSLFESLTAALQSSLETMKSKGHLTENSDPKMLAQLILAIQQGAAAMLKLNGQCDLSFAIIEEGIRNIKTVHGANDVVLTHKHLSIGHSSD
ncbi:MAG: TetR/AcrR family transcriptional repressor of nem operon [Glaciecola sp.]|jgi:TetR/AcrR family transcriptional repressor of nem operon